MSSLTQLISRGSALRDWFEDEFPNAADQLQLDRPPRQVVHLPRTWRDTAWLLGMAFDWRLRIGLRVPQVKGSTAEAGWQQVEGSIVAHTFETEGERGGYQGPSPTPVHRLMELAKHARGDDRQTRDEATLARVALSLAAYETCFREGVPPDSFLLDVRSDAAVERMLDDWDQPAVDDLAALTAAARRGLRELFPAKTVKLNPVFGSNNTVGADGDLIIDGTLIDLKTVSRPTVKREWVWQQIGYLLLNKRRYPIDHVGFYLSRHARLLRWPVADFIRRAAGRPVTLDGLSGGFADAVANDIPRWPR